MDVLQVHLNRTDIRKTACGRFLKAEVDFSGKSIVTLDPLKVTCELCTASLYYKEEALRALTDWVKGIIRHHTKTENRDAEATLALAMLVKMRKLSLSREDKSPGRDT